MPHNVGGTVSKADLSAAENSFATASAAFETAQTNYNNAQSQFFSLENQLITADGELFEAQVNFDKVDRDPSSTKSDRAEALENLSNAEEARSLVFTAFRAKDVVVQQSESLFFQSERTYFEEQDHLFQVQDQFNFQVSELRESTGVRSGIQNNFDQYLFTGRDSATDATNRSNAQTQLERQNEKLATQELELEGMNRALSYVSEDWEGIWIRLGRVRGAQFGKETLTPRKDALLTGQEEIDTPVNEAFNTVQRLWVSEKTNVINLWVEYSFAFDVFTLSTNTIRNNPGLIKELELANASLDDELRKIGLRLEELGAPFKKGQKVPDEALTLERRGLELEEQKSVNNLEIRRLQDALSDAQELLAENGPDFGTDYVNKLKLHQAKIREIDLTITSIENNIRLKEAEINDSKVDITSTESEIEQYEAILRPKEDALAITEIFVEQVAGAITAGGDSETAVIRAAKQRGQEAGENLTATDALALARSYNWSMKQIKSKITEAANKGETSIIVEALSPATVSVLNDMGYNMRLIGVEKTVIAGGIGEQRREIAVDQEVEISWLFAREADTREYQKLG